MCGEVGFFDAAAVVHWRQLHLRVARGRGEARHIRIQEDVYVCRQAIYVHRREGGSGFRGERERGGGGAGDHLSVDCVGGVDVRHH